MNLLEFFIEGLESEMSYFMALVREPEKFSSMKFETFRSRALVF